MVNIVMVCTGNICRSPMAERLLLHMLPAGLQDQAIVHSAGIYALHGHQAAEPAIEAMAQLGIDLSDHRARQLTREIEQQADILLGMEHQHLAFIKSLRRWGRSKAKLLGEFASRDEPMEIEDPYGQPLEAYQACIETLRPCLAGVVQWLEESQLTKP